MASCCRSGDRAPASNGARNRDSEGKCMDALFINGGEQQRCIVVAML